MPPKSWKKTIPSSGRWIFKLRLGASGDTGGVVGGDGEENYRSGNTVGKEATGTDDDIDMGEKLREHSSASDHAAAGDDDQRADNAERIDTEKEAAATGSGPDGVVTYIQGDEPQQQEGHQLTTTEEDSAVRKPAAPAANTIPTRALCRQVAEKYLSWELRDEDFCVPDKPGDIRAKEDVGKNINRGVDGAGGEGEAEKEVEETAAIRAALRRREMSLLEALRGVQTNDEAGGSVRRGSE